MVIQVDQFFKEDGSLIHIPARNSKKIEVLKIIAQRFEVGKKYPEKDLNRILGEIHSDTAALRRHMIEFGIMERDSESTYWLKSRTMERY